MAILDEIGRKISQTGQNVVKGTRNMADIARLNSMVSDEEKKINAFYNQLGRLYVNEQAEHAQTHFGDLVDQLYASEQRVLELKAQIQTIKGVKKCPSCGSEIPENAPFCSHCGTNVYTPKPVDLASMTKCPSCAKLIPIGTKFCTYCGATVDIPKPTGGKVCAQCGNVLEEGMAFCNKCGAKYEQPQESIRPTAEPVVEPIAEPAIEPASPARVCALCGNVLEEGMKFCNKCGALYVQTQASDSPTDEPIAEPTAEPVANERVCAQCGEVLEDDVVFCTNCGAKYEQQPAADSPAVEPAPEEPVAQVRTCPKCGNELEPSVEFCTRCGTKVD